MEAYFNLNSYFTSEKKHRSLMDRFFLGSRFWFHFNFIRTIFKYRPYAIKGLYDNKLWAKSSKEMMDLVERCGGKIQIEGLDHVREEQKPVVFVANHMSTAETQLLPGIIEPIKHFTFVVKESLTTGPIWGPIMRARKPISVSQIDPRKDMEKVMQEGVELLTNGCSVMIFPEGKRAQEFNPENFNSLGIRLAKKANVKIQPLALKTDFWQNGKIMVPFGKIDRSKKIHFKFDKAFHIEGNGKKQHQEIISFIETHLKKWS